MTGWGAILMLAIGLGVGLFLLNEIYELIRRQFKEED